MSTLVGSWESRATHFSVWYTIISKAEVQRAKIKKLYQKIENKMATVWWLAKSLWTGQPVSRPLIYLTQP